MATRAEQLKATLKHMWEAIENHSAKEGTFAMEGDSIEDSLPKRIVAFVAKLTKLGFECTLKPQDQGCLERLNEIVTSMNGWINRNAVEYKKGKGKRHEPTLDGMSLAAGAKVDFPVNIKGYDVIVYGALTALLMVRDDEATRALNLYTDNPTFLGSYGHRPDFQELGNDVVTTLRRFANCLKVAHGIIGASQNKDRLLKISSCLTEGVVYITGTGESRDTRRRVIIFEEETGSEKATRKKQVTDTIDPQKIISNAFVMADHTNKRQRVDDASINPQSGGEVFSPTLSSYDSLAAVALSGIASSQSNGINIKAQNSLFSSDIGYADISLSTPDSYAMIANTE